MNIFRKEKIESDKVDLQYLHSLDADMDQIARHYNLESCSLDEINNLIINGVSVQTAFELSEDYILSNAEYPDNLFKILSFFYTLGITSEQIRSIISRIIPTMFIDKIKLFSIKSTVDDIVSSSPDKWSSIGIEPSEYAKPWIRLNYCRYLSLDSGYQKLYRYTISSITSSSVKLNVNSIIKTTLSISLFEEAFYQLAVTLSN